MTKMHSLVWYVSLLWVLLTPAACMAPGSSTPESTMVAWAAMTTAMDGQLDSSDPPTIEWYSAHEWTTATPYNYPCQAEPRSWAMPVLGFYAAASRTIYMPPIRFVHQDQWHTLCHEMLHAALHDTQGDGDSGHDGPEWAEEGDTPMARCLDLRPADVVWEHPTPDVVVHPTNGTQMRHCETLDGEPYQVDKCEPGRTWSSFASQLCE